MFPAPQLASLPAGFVADPWQRIRGRGSEGRSPMFVTSCAVCECSLAPICPPAVSCGSGRPSSPANFRACPKLRLRACPKLRTQRAAHPTGDPPGRPYTARRLAAGSSEPRAFPGGVGPRRSSALKTIGRTLVPIATFAPRTSRGVVGAVREPPLQVGTPARRDVRRPNGRGSTHGCRGDAVCRPGAVVHAGPTSPNTSARVHRTPRATHRVAPTLPAERVCSVEEADRKLPAVSNEATKRRLSLPGRGRRAAPGEGRLRRGSTFDPLPHLPSSPSP